MNITRLMMAILRYISIACSVYDGKISILAISTMSISSISES